MTQVEVAMVGKDLTGTSMGDIQRDWYEGFWEGEKDLTWDERRRVTLTVSDDEMLKDMLSSAIDELGIYEADWADWSAEPNDPNPDPGVRTRRFIALRDDDSPLRLEDRLSVGLTRVDSEGHAVWGGWHYDATYAELRDAAEAGALPGDPRQMYLLVRPDAAGGGIYHEFQLLLQAWDEAFKVIVALAAINETHDLYLKVRERLSGRSTIRREAEDWVRRNGHADSLAYMLRGEPWSAFELAALLGCTKSEAEDILKLYGYEWSDAEGVWTYVAGNSDLGLSVEDVSAQTLVRFRDEVWRRYLDGDSAPAEELQALFQEIIRQADQGEIGDLRHVTNRDPLGSDLSDD